MLVRGSWAAGLRSGAGSLAGSPLQNLRGAVVGLPLSPTGQPRLGPGPQSSLCHALLRVSPTRRGVGSFPFFLLLFVCFLVVAQSTASSLDSLGGAEWPDGWMDGWPDGWTDGWMGGWVSG